MRRLVEAVIAAALLGTAILVALRYCERRAPLKTEQTLDTAEHF